MSGFPLYDNLIKDLPKKDLSAKQKTEFVENIKLIDDSGKELLYALVQFYYINSEPKLTIPYRSKVSKKKPLLVLLIYRGVCLISLLN